MSEEDKHSKVYKIIRGNLTTFEMEQYLNSCNENELTFDGLDKFIINCKKIIEEFCCLQQENDKLKQQLKDKDEKISKVREYIKENVKAELLNGSIWIDKYKLLNILEGKEDK